MPSEPLILDWRCGNYGGFEACWVPMANSALITRGALELFRRSTRCGLRSAWAAIRNSCRRRCAIPYLRFPVRPSVRRINGSSSLQPNSSSRVTVDAAPLSWWHNSGLPARIEYFSFVVLRERRIFSKSTSMSVHHTTRRGEFRHQTGQMVHRRFRGLIATSTALSRVGCQKEAALEGVGARTNRRKYGRDRCRTMGRVNIAIQRVAAGSSRLSRSLRVCLSISPKGRVYAMICAVLNTMSIKTEITSPSITKGNPNSREPPMK
jgi:hypothetical protein